MTTEPLAQRSSLDSDRFGRRIYRAEARAPEDVQQLLGECKTADAEMLIVRCPVVRPDVACDLQAAGAVLMDTLVYYAARTDSREVVAPPAKRVRRFVPADLSVLEEVGRAAFTGYGGHYHADSRLDSVAATEGYVDWLRRSTADPETAVWVATNADVPLGFLTLRRAGVDRPAQIVLNAVAPAAQGTGLYDALVKSALLDCRAHGEARVVTSTQLSNVAPQKVWVRNGFEPMEAFYTFHHWFV